MTDLEKPMSARRQQTRARLMEAAYEVFTEVGMDAASVEAICERAGFTRGAFYSNFDTKGELFVAIMAEHVDAKLTDVGERIRSLPRDGEQDILTAISQIVGAALGVHVQPELVGELCTQALRDPRLGAAYLEWHDALQSGIARLIQDIATEFDLTLRVPVETLASFVIGIVDDAATTAKIRNLGAEEARQEVAERIRQLSMMAIDQRPDSTA